jgi:hypothetical protein
VAGVSAHQIGIQNEIKQKLCHEEKMGGALGREMSAQIQSQGQSTEMVPNALCQCV